MSTIKVSPNLSWRNGRPRWVPGPTIRAKGWKPVDLKDEAGQWLSLDAAVKRATELNRAIVDRQNQGFKRAPAKGQIALVFSLEDLFEALWKSPKFSPGQTEAGRVRRRVLSARTVKDYKQKAHALRDFDPELWTSPVAALTPPILHGLHEQLWQTKGHHMANGMIAVLRLALSYGVQKGKGGLKFNPALRLAIETPEARLRVASFDEIKALIEAADRLNLPEIGDSIYLGLFTGQRQGDRLTLQDAGADAGRRIFRQAKTGSIVEVPDAPQLAVRLASARERKQESQISAAEIVIRTTTGTRFDEHSYRKAFAAVRRDAVKTCPSLADFRDQDLRDTSVTWLARAGCTIPQIRSITGHSEKSIYSILKHYLAVDAGMAGEAIGHLVAWLEREGVAL